MKKSNYETPQAELYDIKLENSILSNVQRVTSVSGNGWYDDDYDF